jgi:hypothetical protein
MQGEKMNHEARDKAAKFPPRIYVCEGTDGGFTIINSDDERSLPEEMTQYLSIAEHEAAQKEYEESLRVAVEALSSCTNTDYCGCGTYLCENCAALAKLKAKGHLGKAGGV